MKKIHQGVFFRFVNFSACILYLKKKRTHSSTCESKKVRDGRELEAGLP